MMCFRVGCPRGMDGPGSVEFVLNIGTKGNIGSSVAVLTLKFCSASCREHFLIEHPNQRSILGHFDIGPVKFKIQIPSSTAKTKRTNPESLSPLFRPRMGFLISAPDMV